MNGDFDTYFEMKLDFAKRRAPKAPAWACRIIAQVAVDSDSGKVPAVNWRRRRQGTGSSGHIDNDYARHITVTAGKDRLDQRHVLLHELAHWLHPHEWHSAEFYRTCFHLHNKFAVPGLMTHAKKREYAYHPRTAKAGYRLYLADRRRAAAESQAVAACGKGDQS